MAGNPHDASLVPSDIVTITPGDTTAINIVGFYVGVTGDVAVRTTKGTSGTFVAVPAGAIIAGKFDRIKSTGTTATSIIGFMS